MRIEYGKDQFPSISGQCHGRLLPDRIDSRENPRPGLFIVRWFRVANISNLLSSVRIRRVAILSALMFFIGAGMRLYNVSVPDFIQQLRNLTVALENQIFSQFTLAKQYNRIHESHATVLMIQARKSADQMQLDRAFQDKNAAYERARWRFALEPFEMKVIIDDIHYRFLSDELILNRYRADHLNLFNTIAFKEHGEFLPWELFGTIHYDQLPRQLTEFIINLQTDHFGNYLKPEYWPDMGVEEWRLIPDTIRKIAAYRMAWLWAVEYAPPWIRPEEAARLVASIGRVESLFDLRYVVNRNPTTGKEDLGFMQISDALRHRLRQTPEFREYSHDDFLKPWVSVQAGAYSFFNIFLPYAGGDVLKAIGYYNTGRNGPKHQAESYLKMVALQFNRAFVDRTYSPTLYLILERAEPEYFRDARADVLFRENEIEG